MKANGWQIKEMDLAFRNGLMEVNTKVHGRMIRRMGKGTRDMQVVMYI